MWPWNLYSEGMEQPRYPVQRYWKRWIKYCLTWREHVQEIINFGDVVPFGLNTIQTLQSKFLKWQLESRVSRFTRSLCFIIVLHFSWTPCHVFWTNNENNNLKEKWLLSTCILEFRVGKFPGTCWSKSCLCLFHDQKMKLSSTSSFLT